MPRRFVPSCLCTALVLLLITPSVQARLVPWLAGASYNSGSGTSSVYACLEDSNTGAATVDYGLTNAYGLQATSESYQASDLGYYVQNVKMTGLLPNTVYHYKVTHPSTGLVTSDYTFRTAPAPGTAARWGFAADCRSDPTSHNMMAGRIAAQNPNMMVYGGDLPASGTWAYWNQQWFMAPYDPSLTNQINLNATTPWVNATGNHEGWNSLTAAFTQGPSDDGVGGNGYFSFDYGDTHIVVLNNLYGVSPGNAQWNWVAGDLAASTRKWKIVTSHYPAYSYGSHGGDANMQALTTQVLQPNGVDLVLSGHNHFYQHNLINGIHHMTIGSFGVGPSTAGSGPGTVWSETTMCFGMIDTTANSLTLTTYRSNGSVIETIMIPEPATIALLALLALSLPKRGCPMMRRRGERRV